jgi:succinate-acetate transporter protein
MTAVHSSDIHPELAELKPGWHFADPAPLGLAAFALTTFVLSFMNTHVFKAEPVVFGLALAYGGGVQILAGMWEFAKGNTFGATAFCSYGGFWISFWYLTGHTNLGGLAAGDLNKSLGIWVVGWTIFTAYMFIASLRTNLALVAVFGVLTLTFLFLAIGYFTVSATATSPDMATKIGGWLGILTALLAWYASFAGVLSSTFKRQVLPVMPRA